MSASEEKKSAPGASGAQPQQDEASAANSEQDAAAPTGPLAFADELGIEELGDVLHGHKGRIFSAAGRNSPIAEFRKDGVLLRPPQIPYSDEPPKEEVKFDVDDRGVLLNELGEPRRIIGAKYKGRPIYTLSESAPESSKHYVAWFDDESKPHRLLVQGQPVTSDMLFRIRNRTPDGEVGIFPEVTSE